MFLFTRDMFLDKQPLTNLSQVMFLRYLNFATFIIKYLVVTCLGVLHCQTANRKLYVFFYLRFCVAVKLRH